MTPLTTEDLWPLDSHNTTNYILRQFNKLWLPSIARKRNDLKKEIKLLSPILRTFWFDMFIVGFIKFIGSSLVFVNPLVLDKIISFMSPTNFEPEWRGYFYASLMLISPLFESLLNSQYEYRINLVGMRMRAVIISVVYKKVRIQTHIYQVQIIKYDNRVLSCRAVAVKTSRLEKS